MPSAPASTVPSHPPASAGIDKAKNQAHNTTMNLSRLMKQQAVSMMNAQRAAVVKKEPDYITPGAIALAKQWDELPNRIARETMEGCDHYENIRDCQECRPYSPKWLDDVEEWDSLSDTGESL